MSNEINNISDLKSKAIAELDSIINKFNFDDSEEKLNHSYIYYMGSLEMARALYLFSVQEYADHISRGVEAKNTTKILRGFF